MKKELKIDSENLINALEDHSDSFNYFLDFENGNVVSLFKNYFKEEIEEGPVDLDGYNHEIVENNPDRFIFINPIDSRESFKIMEDFVSTILNDLIKNTLSLALSKRKPFRNFKDELNHLPEIQKEWYKYHEIEMEKIAYEWLEDNDMTAELIRKYLIDEKTKVIPPPKFVP
jgi:hypothetical protein